jgi:hypothetical protein
MLDRIGLGWRRRANGLFEARPHATVIGGEVVVPQGALLADAEQHVHVLGTLPLNAGDAVAVEAELQHVGGLSARASFASIAS